MKCACCGKKISVLEPVFTLDGLFMSVCEDCRKIWNDIKNDVIWMAGMEQTDEKILSYIEGAGLPAAAYRDNFHDYFETVRHRNNMEAEKQAREAAKQAREAAKQARLEKEAAAEQKRIDEILRLRPTYIAAPYAVFDDSARKVAFSTALKKKYMPADYFLLQYDQIVSYELIEDSAELLKGGVGRAIIGGLGGLALGTLTLSVAGAVSAARTGAMLGTSTRNQKHYCTELFLKLTVRGLEFPACFIQLIQKDMDKRSEMYQMRMREAQSIISKLELIIKEREDRETSDDRKTSGEIKSIPDMLREYKALYDEGIITMEEFETQKRKLLEK